MPQRKANGKPARQPPAPTRDRKGDEHRKGNGREPRRVRDRAQATAEKHGSVTVEKTRRKKSLHRENPKEPETGAPAKRTRGHPLESVAVPREAAATD